MKTKREIVIQLTLSGLMASVYKNGALERCFKVSDQGRFETMDDVLSYFKKVYVNHKISAI